MAHGLDAKNHVAHDFRRNGLHQLEHADQIALAGRHVTLPLKRNPFVRNRVGGLAAKHFTHNAFPRIVRPAAGGVILAEGLGSHS